MINSNGANERTGLQPGSVDEESASTSGDAHLASGSRKGWRPTNAQLIAATVGGGFLLLFISIKVISGGAEGRTPTSEQRIMSESEVIYQISQSKFKNTQVCIAIASNIERVYESNYEEFYKVRLLREQLERADRTGCL